jgi:hypothetical protein
MLKSAGPLALAVTVAAGAGQAAPVEKQTLTLANTSSRIVECALLVDGKTRTLLKIRPGQAYAGKAGGFGGGGRVELTAAA